MRSSGLRTYDQLSRLTFSRSITSTARMCLLYDIGTSIPFNPIVLVSASWCLVKPSRPLVFILEILKYTFITIKIALIVIISIVFAKLDWIISNYGNKLPFALEEYNASNRWAVITIFSAAIAILVGASVIEIWVSMVYNEYLCLLKFRQKNNTNMMTLEHY